VAWIAEECPFCAGKHAEEPICHAFTGVLQESAAWLFGEEFEVRQTACRAMGASACIWEVNKTPKQ
jgi:predicted hydrocarbon binding protein